MTAQQYLSQLEILDIKIQQKRKEAYDLRLMALNTGSPVIEERVQTSPSGDGRQMAYVEEYLDLEEQIKAEEAEYVREKNKTINEIQSLDDKRYIQVLYLRYVPDPKLRRGLSLMEIARKINYSYSHTKKISFDAHKMFYEKFLNNTP